MREFQRVAGIGALILGLALIGFMVYETVLYPNAGFPTEDFAVIVAGADTLRVGHLLKFVYAGGLVLLLVGLYSQLRPGSLVLAQLGAISGIAAATLLLASGMLGLRILQVAEDKFVTKQAEAITTILLRSVTIALFEAAIFASGFFVLIYALAMVRTNAVSRVLGYVGVILGILFIADRVLVFPFNLISVVVAIGWSFGLAYLMLRRPVQAPVNAAAKV